MQHLIKTFVLVLTAAFLASCSPYNYLEKARPMYMACPVEKSAYMHSAANIFESKGYKIVERNEEDGVLMVRDSIDDVAWRYESLVRTWRIQYFSDSVKVQVWSVSTRKDGSDVTQTWDKQWSDEIVKEWMRPVMTSLETACGLGSPLRPN